MTVKNLDGREEEKRIKGPLPSIILFLCTVPLYACNFDRVSMVMAREYFDRSLDLYGLLYTQDTMTRELSLDLIFNGQELKKGP